MSNVDFAKIFRQKEYITINEISLDEIIIAENAKASFVVAFNKAAKTNYKVLNLKFYDPVLITTNLPEFNSLIVVKLLPDLARVGDYHISYNRLHVSDLGTINVLVTGHSLISDVLNQVNELTNSVIDYLDIVDGPLPPGDANGRANIDLVFNNSLLYYSEPRIQIKSEVITVPNITKASVGLGNADNTSDINKPVSILQQAADINILNLAKAYTDSVVINNPGGSGGEAVWSSVDW